MMFTPARLPAFMLASLLLPTFAAQADNADTANKSNNPLNLAPGANLQDYYTPKLYDSDAHTNDLLLRGTLPIAPSDFIGVPQLLRATLPLSTRPDPHSGYSTGIGDLNLFDIFLLKTDGVQLGIGPQITAPTAEHDELGTGKWQAGLAAIAIDGRPVACWAHWCSTRARSPATGTGRTWKVPLFNRSSSITCPRAGTCAPPAPGPLT